MVVLQSSGISFRTKCLTLSRAKAFARALEANSRFREVDVNRSARAHEPACWFVTFLPAKEERLQQLRQQQQDARAERAATQAFTFCADRDTSRLFYWTFSHQSGETYATTPHSCDCMDAQVRCAPSGLLCKHSLALRSALSRGEVEEFDRPAPRAAVDAEREERRRTEQEQFMRIFG